MVEFTEFERAKGNGQYETMVPLDEAQAEIARLQARIQELDIKRNDAVDLWLDAENRIHTAWNDAIDAVLEILKGRVWASHVRDEIRAIKRPTSEVSNG